MSLGPTETDLVARARSDLRMGVPVVLTGGGAGLLVLAAETAPAERLAAMEALGPVVLTLTRRRADTLKIRAYDGDVARVRLPAPARLSLIHGLADPANDLRYPMKGPLASEREGAADLHRAAIALIKSAHLLPAAIVAAVEAPLVLAAEQSLTLLTGAETIHADTLTAVTNARVPLRASEASRLHVFRPGDGSEEHYAIDIGPADRDAPVLVRLHSACVTGDILGSLKCDCGPQLNAALAQMGAEGAGILLYLNQEGRGIGLANKMRAYALQDQGFDTVEANHRLGFEDDERDFRIGAAILTQLGVRRVRLMTNNPAKLAKLEGCGIEVTERVPLQVGETAHNEAYLATKAAKSGHLL